MKVYLSTNKTSHKSIWGCGENSSRVIGAKVAYPLYWIMKGVFTKNSETIFSKHP
jgi:hypothetical protein